MLKVNVFFVLFSISLQAQDSVLTHPSLLLEPLSKGNYLGALQSFEKSRFSYLNSKYANMFRIYLAYYNTFLAEYEGALAEMDSVSWRRGVVNSDTTLFSGLTLSDASHLIPSMARNKRAVFFNESHHQPRHRVFLTSLLDSLYSLGYRYLMSELIDPSTDSRGYPKVIFSGRSFYINEPCYANLLRQAHRIGFTVLSYEDTSSGFRDIQSRELNQARNIATIFEKDPAARIIVHAGAQHINEIEDSKKIAPMALCFQRLTGIDPLTINQSQFTHTSNKELDHPLYVTLAAKFDFKAPSVPLLNGNVFVPSQDSGRFDIAILHPRTEIINGKPDWLINSGRKLTPIPKSLYEGMGLPLLVQARFNNENDNAVPIDQTLIRKSETNYYLCLPIGEFRVRIVNDNNDVISEFISTVK